MALAVVLVLGLVFSACGTSSGGGAGGGGGGGQASAGPPKPGGTLSVGLSAETNGWNPTNSQWAAQAYWVASTVFEPLMAYGADQKPHPYLAKSMTHNADFTQWTIKLRQGITFQDGEPFNADAVVLQLTKDKASPIVGQSLTAVDSIHKVDDTTVQVDMNRPWAQFPEMMTRQPGYIAAPKQLNATGSELTDHPIGTGPYTFQTWSRNNQLVVTKNPNYWRKGVGFPDKIVFKVITDPQAMLNSLQTGQVDIEFDATVANIVQAQHNGNLHVVEKHLDPPTMIMLNMAVAPTNDLRVRQALAYATSAKELIDRVAQGRAKQATEPYLPNSPWYAPSGYPTSQNLTKARSLLNEYKKDEHISGKVSITLGCIPSTTTNQEMTLLKAQWAKVGFDVKRQTLDQATYINSGLLGKYQANCWTYLGSPDPDMDAVWMLSRNANPPGQLALNFPRLKDPKVDAAYLAAEKTDKPAERVKQYQIVWKQLAKKIPYIWLTHTYGAFVYGDKVHWQSDAKLPDGTAAYSIDTTRVAVAPLTQAWID